ncbi:MAG: coxB [Moraxellaceae bacterium]|jgi:cytochrome c oxidase subunit 2|nr:coxB [Moraxellaceae bacterium]MDF3030361.1 coxB [Moraxellaceae bacterium]
MRSSLIFRAGAALAALVLASSATAIQLDLTPGVTDISQQVFDLHRFMLWICIIIGVGVFGVMFYSIFHHRKSKGVKAADFHESTLVEVIWTVIPFIILIVMAIPATRVLIAMSDTGDADLTVRVTGSQWKWHYEYLSYGENKDVGLGFLSVLSTPREQYERQGKGFSGSNVPDFEKHPNYLVEVDKPLVIPTGKKVRFLITSDDVIHAWWVPDFALKRDAVPGFINEIWTNVPAGKEGVYRGRCAELCGKDHAFMPIVVEAKSQAEFESWLKEAKVKADEEAKAAASSVDYKFADIAEANKLGEEVYTARCVSCHQAGGVGLPPTFPALKGSKIAAAKDQLPAHIEILNNGKNMMPAWKGVLSPKELAAVITYTRNAWGNDTGDLVQPSDVVAK